MNYELGIMGRERSNLRRAGDWITVYRFFAFCFLLFVSLTLVPPAYASSHPLPPLRPFCFRQEECPGTLYQNGRPAVAQECQNQDERWFSAGYIYYCYAPEATVNLSVSVGGYQVTGLGEYIRRFYVYAISITGIVAGIIIIWAGVRWLLSAGNPERITDARKKLSNALVGLLLIVGSYVILQTVNPSLVNLRPPPVKMVRQELVGGEICVNREQYPCGGAPLSSPRTRTEFGFSRTGQRPVYASATGSYQCNDSRIPDLIQNPPCPSGPGTDGECLAQFCPSGTGGCYTLLKDRITEEAFDQLFTLSGGDRRPVADEIFVREFLDSARAGGRACVDSSSCGGCARDVPWGICISSACNCILASGETFAETGPRTGVVCMPPTAVGAECGAHSQCASGRCNFGRVPDRCMPPGGEAAGQPCAEDGDCASNRCNFFGSGALLNVCAPAEGLPDGAFCGTDRACASGTCGWESCIHATVGRRAPQICGGTSTVSACLD